MDIRNVSIHEVGLPYVLITQCLEGQGKKINYFMH